MSKRKQVKQEQGAQSAPPEPKRFNPRPCSSCAAIRPKGESYSVVYATKGSVRYCKCKYCGATWAQAQSFMGDNVTTSVVTRPEIPLQANANGLPLSHVADRHIIEPNRSSDQRLANGRGVVIFNR
jgi:hypothetical protein